MDSVGDHPDGWGCPIRKSPDQSVLATPRSLSQPITSFIASQCQGIRQTPFLCLIIVCQRNGNRLPYRLVPCRGRPPPQNGLLPVPTVPPRRRNTEQSRLLRPHTSDQRCQRTRQRHSHGAVFYAAHCCASDGGGRRDRTDDLLLAKQALSQLSYAPV